MSASSQADGVRALATPLAADVGLVIEDVTVTPAGRRRVLRVTVDLPPDRIGGVPMDRVAQASKSISAALDASNVMGGSPYVLEVSSPGIDRPLTERRHWSRARGRLVTVSRVAGGEVTGRLHVVDDAGIELDNGRLAWADVRKGRIEVEFDRMIDALELEAEYAALENFDDDEDEDDAGDEEART
jgi:ribosome maturation factor RimP